MGPKRTSVAPLVMVASSALLVGCGGCVGYLALYLGLKPSEGRSIEFVLPVGFRGPVTFDLDPGADALPLVDGRYRAVVPADGRLRVNSLAPFYRWHTTSARFADGTPLPTHVDSTAEGDRAVALRDGGSGTMSGGVGTREVRWVSYFVGTKAEYWAAPDLDPRQPP